MSALDLYPFIHAILMQQLTQGNRCFFFPLSTIIFSDWMISKLCQVFIQTGYFITEASRVSSKETRGITFRLTESIHLLLENQKYICNQYRTRQQKSFSVHFGSNYHKKFIKITFPQKHFSVHGFILMFLDKIITNN